jgi:hypothetical protein
MREMIPRRRKVVDGGGSSLGCGCPSSVCWRKHIRGFSGDIAQRRYSVPRPYRRRRFSQDVETPDRVRSEWSRFPSLGLCIDLQDRPLL